MTEYEKLSLLYLSFACEMLHNIGSELRKQSPQEYARWSKQQLKKELWNTASPEGRKLLRMYAPESD